MSDSIYLSVQRQHHYQEGRSRQTGGVQRENAGRVPPVGMDGGYGWEAGGNVDCISIVLVGGGSCIEHGEEEERRLLWTTSIGLKC